jgi:hypothetical protein
MNLKKCAFNVSASQFLGFLVHERGIENGLKSEEAVRTMVPPTMKIKADEEFSWGAEQQ